MANNRSTGTAARGGSSAVRTDADQVHPVRRAAAAVGAVFLLVGVLGFIPGITTHYGDMTFAGHGSDAKLLGIFEVSVLHNIVHLAFGVAGLLAARAVRASRAYLVAGGVIYLALAVYGAIIDRNSGANFVPINNPDNWLHLVLGLGMIGLGVALTRAVRSEARHGQSMGLGAS